MSPPIPLSVAIITKNEAANLPACLESIAFASQVVVVDSGSTDETVKIARDFGCDVYEEDWLGFGRQKQVAVDRCRNEWILILDADERVPPETESLIRELLSRSPAADGYSFPRKNFFQGRWIRHAGWWPDRVVRLFRKSRGGITETLVHEAVCVTGSVIPLSAPLQHFTESSLERLLQKINHYSTLGAEEAFASGRRSSVWGAALRAKLTFFHDYFIRFGFLDGRQGFTLAIAAGVNKFFKYAKLSELSRQRQKPSASMDT